MYYSPSYKFEKTKAALLFTYTESSVVDISILLLFLLPNPILPLHLVASKIQTSTRPKTTRENTDIIPSDPAKPNQKKR